MMENIMDRIRLGIWIIAFSFISVACTTMSGGTATLSVIPTLTLVRQHLTIVPTSTSKPTLTGTPSSTPSPTKTFTPTVTPIPLTRTGPWLIYSVLYDSAPLLCNLDGTGCVPVIMPNESWDFTRYPYLASPKGGYLILYALEDKYNPQLWIVKLPEQKIVRKIPLLSGMVRDALPEKLNPNYPSFYYGLRHPENVQWSPNGRYIAFSSAQEGSNSDLYVYDIVKDTIRRLSKEEESVSILGWSPDSELCIYAIVDEYEYDYPNEASLEIANVGQVNGGEGGIQKTIPIDGQNLILGWTSSTTFIIYQDIFEDAPRDIREVDITTRQIKTLYEGRFAGADLDEITGTIFLFLTDIKGPMEFDQGIYLLNRQTGKLRMILSGDWGWGTYWSKGLDVLVARKDDEKGQGKTLFIDKDGNQIKEFNGYVYPSPSGEWLIISDEFGTKVYNETGEIVAELADMGMKGIYFSWMKDSSGFLGVSDGRLHIYLKENNWIGILAVEKCESARIVYP